MIAGIATAIAPLFGTFVIGPFYQKLKIDSVFQYIELRYKTNTVRLIAMTFFLIKSFITSAVYILGPSTALSLIIGLDTYASIGIICAIGTFYTCIGGIKAVVWTDMFQACVMLAFIGVLLVKGTIDAGGVSEIIKVTGKNRRLEFFDFNPDPFIRQSFWNLLIGNAIIESKICHSI
jgi:sodium-coupled monocarboxylate transporter 8/12